MGNPCYSISLTDPMRYARDYCDKLRACEFEHFDTREEYQACVDAANASDNDCTSACGQRGDPTDANTEHDSCNEGCTDAFETAVAACVSDFNDCISVCPPPGPGHDECIANCANTLAGCEDPLGAIQLTCQVNCDTAHAIAIASLALDIDQACAAACCSTNSKNPTVCEAPCVTAFTQAVVEAEIAQAECRVPCWSWGVIDDEGDKGAIFNQACGDACGDAFDAAVNKAGKTYLECVYPCLGDERCPIAAGYPVYVEALEELPEVSISADGTITTSACALAFSKTYTDSFNACDSDDETCTNEATLTLNRAMLECCWNLRGRSVYEDQLDKCGVTFIRCNDMANDACPAPGTDMGDPCFDPTSEECIAATVAWHECVDPMLAACTTAKDGCVNAITDTPRCDGCPVNNAPPPPAA